MEEPRLDHQASSSGSSAAFPEYATEPQHGPSQFDLMFQEVQDRMHRLFERYAELKRRNRGKGIRAGVGGYSSEQSDSPCHLSTESSKPSTGHCSDGETDAKSCGNPACRCHDSLDVGQTDEKSCGIPSCRSYEFPCANQSDESRSEYQSSHKTPAPLPVNQPIQVHRPVEAETDYGCPYSTANSLPDPIPPASGCPYSTQESVADQLEQNRESCAICAQQACQLCPSNEPGRAETDKQDNGHPPASKKRFTAPALISAPKFAPLPPCKMWNATVTKEPAEQKEPEDDWDFLCEDPTKQDEENEKLQAEDRQTRRRLLGCQIAWKTPRGTAGKMDGSRFVNGEGRAAEPDGLEVSCLPRDAKCRAEPGKLLEEMTAGETKDPLLLGMEPKDVSFQNRPQTALQDAFSAKKRTFLQRSRERQEQIKAKHDRRMRADWADCIPLIIRGATAHSGDHFSKYGMSTTKPRANEKRIGRGDGRCFEPRRKSSRAPDDNIISLKTARDETNRRLLQMQTKKKKSTACLLEEAKMRRFRLVAYSRMVQNRNHYLYDPNRFCC